MHARKYLIMYFYLSKHICKFLINFLQILCTVTILYYAVFIGYYGNYMMLHPPSDITTLVNSCLSVLKQLTESMVREITHACWTCTCIHVEYHEHSLIWCKSSAHILLQLCTCRILSANSMRLVMRQHGIVLTSLFCCSLQDTKVLDSLQETVIGSALAEMVKLDGWC